MFTIIIIYQCISYKLMYIIPKYILFVLYKYYIIVYHIIEVYYIIQFDKKKNCKKYLYILILSKLINHIWLYFHIFIYAIIYFINTSLIIDLICLKFIWSNLTRLHIKSIFFIYFISLTKLMFCYCAFINNINNYSMFIISFSQYTT